MEDMSYRNFRELFGERYYISHDSAVGSEPDGNGDSWDFVIPCRHGEIYPYSDSQLAVFVTSTKRVMNRINALGLTLHQEGDDEAIFLFPLDKFEQVAQVIQPFTPRQAKLAKLGSKNDEFSPPGTKYPPPPKKTPSEAQVLREKLARRRYTFVRVTVSFCDAASGPSVVGQRLTGNLCTHREVRACPVCRNQYCPLHYLDDINACRREREKSHKPYAPLIRPDWHRWVYGGCRREYRQAG